MMAAWFMICAASSGVKFFKPRIDLSAPCWSRFATISTRRDQFLHDLGVTNLRSDEQRGRAVAPPRLVNICTRSDQLLHNLGVTVLRREVECGRTIHRPHHVNIGTRCDQHLHEIDVTVLHSKVQRGSSACAHHDNIGSAPALSVEFTRAMSRSHTA